MPHLHNNLTSWSTVSPINPKKTKRYFNKAEMNSIWASPPHSNLRIKSTFYKSWSKTSWTSSTATTTHSTTSRLWLRDWMIPSGSTLPWLKLTSHLFIRLLSIQTNSKVKILKYLLIWSIFINKSRINKLIKCKCMIVQSLKSIRFLNCFKGIWVYQDRLNIK